MRKTLSSKTSLEVIITLVCDTSAATMLDQGFSIHHERAKDPARQSRNRNAEYLPQSMS
jgi:hypothetical protein